jgi:antitoxin VapB
MGVHLRHEKEASVFRNGRSQAVRIPKEFEFDADKVIISRDADGSLHLRPKARKMSLIEALDWLKEQGPMEDFPGDPGDDGLLPLDDVEL